MDKQIIKSDKTYRIDLFLSQKLQISRSQAGHFIKKNGITINGKAVSKCGYKIIENDIITINPIKEQEKLDDVEVDFDVDIIYEDESILVIDKPSDVVIHKAPSVKVPTLVDWLKFKNFKLSTISGEFRYGIVHRLDKQTSGAMVVAKTNSAHSNLSKQLESKSMGRFYLAIIDLPLKDNCIIQKPLARNNNNRLKISVCPDGTGRDAKSALVKLGLSKNEKYELIAIKLFTGRTHQIRAHLAYINRHILGDTLYGYVKNDIPRVFLHSFILYLRHPKSDKEQKFDAKIPVDMELFLKHNFDFDDIYEHVSKINYNSMFDNIIDE
jgi:23S rRNA pseudouridine1911/1915/1917 synthase